MSARDAASMRKQCILARAAGDEDAPNWDELDGQWRPGKLHKARVARTPKGRRHDLDLFARCVTDAAAIQAIDRRSELLAGSCVNWSASRLLILHHSCRVDKIQAALAQQDKKRADYKKSLPAKPLSEGLLQYVKKNAWER